MLTPRCGRQQPGKRRRVAVRCPPVGEAPRILVDSKRKQRCMNGCDFQVRRGNALHQKCCICADRLAGDMPIRRNRLSRGHCVMINHDDFTVGGEGTRRVERPCVNKHNLVQAARPEADRPHSQRADGCGEARQTP